MHGTFDDPRLTAMGLFIEVHKGLASALGGLFTRHGLSGNDFDVLIRLARSPGHGLRMTDLAGQACLSTSGVTRIIDRLERAGLVRREACASDRRGYLTVLTDAGRQRLEEVVPSLTEGIEEHFTGALPPEELDAFLTALRTLRAKVHPHALDGFSPPVAPPESC